MQTPRPVPIAATPAALRTYTNEQVDALWDALGDPATEATEIEALAIEAEMRRRDLLGG